MWLGLIIGTVCLVGLVHAIRGPRWHHRHWARARMHQGLLYSVLDRLDTTPGQEKAIVEALRELRGSLWDLRPSVKEARADLSRSLSGAAFDEARFSAAEGRIQGETQKAGGAFRLALQKIHATLDDRQRQRLGSLIESGCCW
jgi:hypothetical protein